MGSIKFNIRYLLVVLIVILTFTPAIGYFPVFRVKWIFLLLGIALLSQFNTNFLTSKRFFCLALSAIIMSLNVFSKDVYYSQITIVFAEISMLVLVVMMANYAIREDNKRLFLKWGVMTFFAIVLIETFATYIINQQIPGAIRTLFSEGIITGERNELMYPYYKLGLSNYTLPHAMPMLIPPLVMGFRERSNSKKLKIWSLVFLIIALELIWLSGVMTAFLMAIMFLLLSIYTSFSKKPSMKILVLFGLFFLPFLFFDELTVYVLQVSQNIFSGNGYIYKKLLLLEENVNSNGTIGDLAARQNRYLVSINEFLNNIIIGTNNRMGNHSAFMDRLGTLGLVGFVPYIMFYYTQLKFIRKYIPKKSLIYFDEAMAAGLLMLLLKSVDNWEVYFTLFTVLPLLVIFLSPNKIVK